MLLLKMIEIDEPGPCTAFLLSKLADKKPKIPPTCLEVLREAVIAFGAKPFPIRDLITSLGPVLNGTNSLARDGAMALMLELSKWIGTSPFHSLLDSIRAVQKSEFETKVAERTAEGPITLCPTIWLRRERPAPGSAAAAGVVKGASALDSREFVEEIDLPKKLRSTEYANLIVSHQ